MIFYVYILYSSSLDKYYVGQTENLDKRLSEHIIRKNLNVSDWQIKYTEQFETRAKAVKRELEIKKKKRKSYIEWLINNSTV